MLRVVELIRSDVDLGDGVVPVRDARDPVVIEQAVAVAEFDAL